MTSTAAEEQAEKAQAEGLIAETPPFIGIDSVRIELGEDSTGDPSMWLVFSIRRDLATDVPWVRAFADYSTKLTLKLVDSGLARFPYTRLERSA